jgi:membrane-bound acyltransferase YfiQ involved in biofilm formation
MTLQFYLILPLFLWFIGHARRHPWIVLSISFVLQFMELYADWWFVAGPNAAHSAVLNTINIYQTRLVLLYQFYFILGGLAAVNLDRVRLFIARSGRWLLVWQWWPSPRTLACTSGTSSISTCRRAMRRQPFSR